MKSRKDTLQDLTNILHLLHRDTDNIDNSKDDPFYTIQEGSGCRSYPYTRDAIVNYIKDRLNDSKFIETILSDEFIDVDDPEILKQKKIEETKAKYSFDEEIIELITEVENEDVVLDSDGESEELEQLVSDIKTYSGYIVVFDDSDGERVWYKKVQTKEVLDYVIKNDHRKCIGMGCNQYIHMIIKDGHVVEGLVK